MIPSAHRWRLRLQFVLSARSSTQGASLLPQRRRSPGAQGRDAFRRPRLHERPVARADPERALSHHSQDRRRRHGRSSTRREHVVIEKRVALKVLRARLREPPDGSSASGRRPRAPRASATRTSSTSPTSARRPTARSYFVMELLDGQALADEHARRAGAASAAAHHHRCACSARGARGRARQGHRPPRHEAREHLPRRQRVRATDFVKILDFGIAKMSDIETDGSRAASSPRRA